jgi:hypothetical protein
MSNITAKQVLRYCTLPGFIPRLRRITGSGFSNVAIFMAYVYYGVGLLPASHPYLSSENMGRFGIRHVISEAANNLVFSKKHLDQILVFFLLLSVLVILTMQFLLLIIALTIPYANAVGWLAAPADFGAWITQFFGQNPAVPAVNDVAFVMMDYVFGIPGVFDSCVALNVSCFDFDPANFPQLTATPPGPFPNSLHEALHILLEFYNRGILVVGLIIFMYFAVAIVAETAQSGTPFGRRFNHFWAPVRLMAAFFLLIPVTEYGISFAQLLTLNVAKWGSNLATNGWEGFNNQLIGGTTLLGDRSKLVATPKSPEMNTLLEFIFTAKTCMYAEDVMHNRTIVPYLVSELDLAAVGAPTTLAGTSFNAALALGAGTDQEMQDIRIRFGEYDPQYTQEANSVDPTCGEIVIPIHDVEQDGPMSIQESYYDLIGILWTGGAPFNGGAAPCGDIPLCAENIAKLHLPDTTFKDPSAPRPEQVFTEEHIATLSIYLDAAMTGAVIAQIGEDWTNYIRPLGWGGAGLWYQRIAEMNGGMYSASMSIPAPNLWPKVMEYVREQRRAENEETGGTDRFNPKLSDGNLIEFPSNIDKGIALTLYEAERIWFDSYPAESNNNMFLDAIQAVLGIQGLFTIMQNTDIHPLAQLVAMGRVLVEGSVIRLIGGTAAGFVFMGAEGQDLASVGQSASKFFVKVGLIGMSLGFILFYLIPFLPFVYFFFAVAEWVKSIFEAMVGMPLFALAHIRIDGNGLPGPAAMNGYFLLLEILIRPIMLIFGLVASIAIFSAQVTILHEIWPLVVSNVMGFDEADAAARAAGTTGNIEFLRGKADELFFMIIYTIVVFMLAMASFKMIDAVPDNMLRWMNAGVSTFGEFTKDPASELLRNLFYGIQQVVGQVSDSTAMMNLIGRNG